MYNLALPLITHKWGTVATLKHAFIVLCHERPFGGKLELCIVPSLDSRTNFNVFKAAHSPFHSRSIFRFPSSCISLCDFGVSKSLLSSILSSEKSPRSFSLLRHVLQLRNNGFRKKGFGEHDSRNPKSYTIFSVLRRHELLKEIFPSTGRSPRSSLALKFCEFSITTAKIADLYQ